MVIATALEQHCPNAVDFCPKKIYPFSGGKGHEETKHN